MFTLLPILSNFQKQLLALFLFCFWCLFFLRPFSSVQKETSYLFLILIQTGLNATIALHYVKDLLLPTQPANACLKLIKTLEVKFVQS